MRLTDIRESGNEPKKSSTGGTIRKTATGLTHTSEPDDDEHKPAKSIGFKPNLKSREDKPIDRKDRGETQKTKSGVIHKAGTAYSGKAYNPKPTDRLNDPGDPNFKLKLPDGGKQGGSHKHRIGEATGDEQFDGMMGKITGSETPQTAGGTAADRVNAAANQPPTEETIKALNKMMYDMHKTMQTANQLMQKLMRDK